MQLKEYMKSVHHMYNEQMERMKVDTQSTRFYDHIKLTNKTFQSPLSKNTHTSRGGEPTKKEPKLKATNYKKYFISPQRKERELRAENPQSTKPIQDPESINHSH